MKTGAELVMAEKTPERCELCGRAVPLTWHHLIPRAVHGKRRYLRKFGKVEMQQRGANVCRLCHSGIHDLFTEKELAEHFQTTAALLRDERMRKHVAWVRKQKQ